MKLNRYTIFILSILFILLISLTAISATDNTTNTNTSITTINTPTTTNNNIQENTIDTSKTNTIKENLTQTITNGNTKVCFLKEKSSTETVNTNKKSIEKTINSNTEIKNQQNTTTDSIKTSNETNSNINTQIVSTTNNKVLQQTNITTTKDNDIISIPATDIMFNNTKTAIKTANPTIKYTWYVSTTGGGDGKSYDSPTTLATVINSLPTATGVTSIFLKDGTYTYGGTISLNNDKDINITGESTEGTILSGENSYRIMDASNPTAYITNITFINGSTTGNGGAIYASWNSLIVTDCKFINNTAVNGGAISSDTSLTVIGSSFRGNSAKSGNAIYNEGGTVSLENNWWGTNNPTWNTLLSGIDSNPTSYLHAIITKSDSTLNVTFKPSSGTYNGPYPINEVIFTTVNGTVTPTINFTDSKTGTTTTQYTVGKSGYDTITAKIDDQTLTLSTIPVIKLDTIYVNTTAQGTKTGVSWANAVGTISEALNLVSNNGKIILAEGTYNVKGDYSLIISQNVNIIGQTQDKVIIDGLNRHQIMSISSGYGMNITNITFINGKLVNGGAIFNNGTLNLNNCNFINNTNLYHGGAIFNDVNGVLNINNCNFNGDSGYLGGAMFNNGVLNINNCNFTNNNATMYGGVIYNDDFGILNVTVSIFENNTAQYGGLLYNYGTFNITGSTFVNNTAKRYADVLFNSIVNTKFNITNNWWGTNDVNKLWMPNSITGYEGLIFNVNKPDSYLEASLIRNNDTFMVKLSPTDGNYNDLYPVRYVTFTAVNGTVNPSTGYINSKTGTTTTQYNLVSTKYDKVTATIDDQILYYTVEPINTTINITTTPGTSKTNTLFKINVTDTDGNEINTGNVTIRDGNTVLGIIDLSNTNKFSTLLTPAGIYTITVTYNDSNIIYKNNTNTTTVNIETTGTTIVMDNINGTTNENIIIKATVTSNGSLINIGTVTFTDTNGLSKTVNVIYGIATTTTHYTNKGNYTITAIYNANNIYSTNQTTANADIILNDVTMNITVLPSTTMGNTTFNVTVKDIDGNYVNDGNVYFYNNGTLMGNVTIVNGTALFNNKFNTTNDYNITVVYNGTNYNSINQTVNFTVEKANTTLVVNPVVGVVQNTITLQANITDQYGNNVTSGKVVFKINGKTIRDINGNVLYANVTNGVAKLEYIIPRSLTKNNLTIEAKYSGTADTYNPSNNINTINVTKRTANLNVIVTKNPVKAGNNVTFMTIVKDTNGTVLNNGVIIFKFQGHTIRDTNGNSIFVNVTNGIATLTYTIPNGISAKTYNITAVYANKDYNRVETIASITAQKITSFISLNSTTTTRYSNSTLLTGTIKDANGNLMTGTHKINVKLNGKSIGTYKVTNGIINSNISIPNTLKHTNYQITVKIGDTNGYYSSNTTTTLTINNIKTIKQKVLV